MTRRELLAAVKLTMTASALTAATYGLVIAAYDPYAAVQWVPIAAIGLGTATAIAVTAAALFAGRAALLLAGEVVQARRDAMVPPPSAMTPLWRSRPADEVAIAAYAAPGTGRRGLPTTLPLPVDELVAAGREAAGGER